MGIGIYEPNCRIVHLLIILEKYIPAKELYNVIFWKKNYTVTNMNQNISFTNVLHISYFESPFYFYDFFIFFKYQGILNIVQFMNAYFLDGCWCRYSLFFHYKITINQEFLVILYMKAIRQSEFYWFCCMARSFIILKNVALVISLELMISNSLKYFSIYILNVSPFIRITFSATSSLPFIYWSLITID